MTRNWRSCWYRSAQRAGRRSPGVAAAASQKPTSITPAVRRLQVFSLSCVFSPDATCSRAQIVTFLWRSQKSPAVGSVNPFTDVSANAYYTDAVLWAVEENITKGTTATTFSPDADCTRAQSVTLLYRAYVK